MSLKQARTFARYNAWANQLIFDAMAKLPEGEVLKSRQNLFGNMVNTLNHNHAIDLIFQAHLQGRKHGFTTRNMPQMIPLDELWQQQQVIDRWYIDWSDVQTHQALDESVRFTFVGGGEGEMTRGEILFHVVNHTTYHRGFIADQFYQVPAKPPATDLPVFLRDARPHLD